MVSYPTNVSEYTISLISNACGMKLDLLSIWKDQAVPPEYIQNVDYVAPIVGDKINNLCEEYRLIPQEVAKGRKVKGKASGTCF